ncbi:RNA ligase 2 [Aeromonas phage AsFcp_2]|nr:RNA ligase 2 [Aeromonas phage AsFcp_2]
MKFQGYPEMENHTKQKLIFAVQEQGFGGNDVVWTAREKIHGTNFSMWSDAERFTCAKRSQFIGEASGFYDHQVIVARYESKIKELRKAMIHLELCGEGAAVGVFGEYAGIMTHGKWIQTGIEYGPQDFYVFDVLIQEKDGSQFMLEDLQVEELCKALGLKTAPLLKVGTFAEIMKIPVDLQSVVMEVNAGKAIDIRVGTDNIAEGYVAKPNVPARFKNGNRVAIKCKNEKWSETGKGRAVQAVVKELSEKDNALVLDITRYITDNRLKNVLSKMDTPNTNEFGKVLGLMSKDVQKDYERDELDGVSVKEAADEAGRVMRLINTEIGNLIRPNWVSICDGDW